MFMMYVEKQLTDSNFLSSVIGAIIGGIFVALAVWLTHISNKKLAREEKLTKEKITILSLSEELKVIMECYQDEFDNLFKTIEKDKFLRTTYTITQEYFTVYKNNANNLGLIQDKTLRNLFIKIHIILNRLIENFFVYHNLYNEYIERQHAFLDDLNPNLFKREFLKNFDTQPIIQDVQEYPEKYARKDLDNDNGVNRMINFFSNNENEEETLHNKSMELQNIFNEIKILYTQIQSIVGKIK